MTTASYVNPFAESEGTALTRTMGLHVKLAQVMAEVGRVPKRGRNEFHKYDYATEADIVEAVRGALSSRNVALLPAVRKVVREGTLTTATMAFSFVDGDSGETWTSEWAGTGDDKGDKGLYKAMTGALKYFLLKSFLLPTGDDPEADEDTDARTEGHAPATVKSKAARRPAERSATMTPEERATAWGAGPQPVTSGSATDGAAAPAPASAPEQEFEQAMASVPADAPPPAAEQAPDYWRKRTFALMRSLGWPAGDQGKPERMRLYSLALKRMIVTDEHAKAMSSDDWRIVCGALKAQSEPPETP